MEAVRSPKRLSTIRLALSIVYGAGRRETIFIILSTVVTAVAIAGQLLVGRSLLDLLADNDRVEAADLAPQLLLLGLLQTPGESAVGNPDQHCQAIPETPSGAVWVLGVQGALRTRGQCRSDRDAGSKERSQDDLGA